jgi:hypothetical protein
MKTLLSNFWVGFLMFMSPLFPLMLIITISTIFDTFVGRWYAKKKGDVITSGKTRRGLCVKLLVYLSVIFFSFLIDKFMINDITRNYVWFDFAFTRFWTAFFVWVEYTSIDEKVKWVYGEGITDRVMKFLRGFKTLFKNSMDMKDRLDK